MKVYFNGRFLTQRTTGVQRVAHEIIKTLDEVLDNYNHTHEFILVVPSVSKIEAPMKLKNVKIVRYGKFKGHLWEQIELPLYCNSSLLINFCNSAPAFKKNQIVYIHDAAIYSSPLGYSKKFIIWYKILYRLLSRYSREIFTVSYFSKKDIVEHLPNIAKKITVTHIAVDHMKRINMDNSILKVNGLEKGNYLLAVSSMNPNKNFKIIAETMKRIETNVDIVVVGNRNDKVFSTKNSIVDEGNLKFIGYITDKQLKALYLNAKAFIFPSLYEGFGLPPLEAMSLGCPVIASNAASIPEVCGDSAIYFDPNDSNQLLYQINRIINNKTLEHELRKSGLQRSKQFSWKQTTYSLINAIDKFTI